MKKFFVMSVFMLFLSGCAENKFGEDSDEWIDGMRADGTIEPGTQADLHYNVGDTVYFSFDSSAVSSDARDTLHKQAQWLKEHTKTVVVEGHCDNRGTREYNLALGERRANSVKNYLISLGVNKNSIDTISYGKERPAVVGYGDEVWAKNRRAVTVIAK